MPNHPFNEGTKIAQIFELLSDGQWRCGKHELPGTQPAKAIQIIRQNGYDIENSTHYCAVCKDKTVHRRLTSTDAVAPSFVRLQLPGHLRQRVLQHYASSEAIARRRMVPNQLEVDHRFPQVRWAGDESYDPNMSERELHRRFQLLTREHNLWKSRYCERCHETGERGTYIGIEFFWSGGPRWNATI